MKWLNIFSSQKLRKLVGRQNLLAFAWIYLPHYIKYAFAEYHKSFEKHLLDDSLMRCVWIAFRESAKSVFAGLIFPLWAICYNKRNFIIFASDSSDNAASGMTSLVSELEQNKMIINDFGLLYIDPEEHIKSKKKTVKDFITTNDIRVLARGIDQKVRGLRWRQHRPDLVIADDLEDTRHTSTAEGRKRSMDWLEKEMLPAMDQVRGKALVLGNMVHWDCLVAQLAKKENWASLQIPIMSGDTLMWATRHTLTEKEAVEWNQQHPEKPKTSIEWIRFDKGSLNFAQEYLLIPQSDQDAIFYLEWIERNYYDEVSLDDLDIYGGFDPAIRKRDKSDFSALDFIGRHKTTGAIYNLYNEARKITVSEQVDWILEMCQFFDCEPKEKDGKQVWVSKGRVRAFGIEVNAYQLALKQLVDKRSQELGIYLPTKEITTSIDKKLKFKGKLSPMVENGQIKFKKDQQRLITEMVQFPSGVHDDTIDGLYNAVFIMEKDVSESGTYQWFKQQYEEMGGQPQGLSIQELVRKQIG